MDIESIAAKAAQVGAEYTQSVEAIADRDAAEAELLAALVEKVRPALRALSSPIKSGYRHFWTDNVRTASTDTWHDARGLLVAGEAPLRDYPHANTGSYEGSELYLLTDGTFAECDYEGTWSRWQGATSEWTCGLLRLADARAALVHWKLEDIVAGISAALEKQAGTRAKVVKAAAERAEQVRALSSLLGGRK